MQIAPHLRPNCDKILQFPALLKRMEDKQFTELDEIGPNCLMNTIRIPKNIHYLTDRLPKPNYVPLKTKKVDKKRFLQTLAGYQDLDSQNEGSQYEIIRNSMPEIPYHLPKIKNDNSSNYDRDDITVSRKKISINIHKDKDEEPELSLNTRLNDLLENKKNPDLRRLLENNMNKNLNNDDNSLISNQKGGSKSYKLRKGGNSPLGYKKDDKSK